MEFTKSGIRRYFRNTSWLMGGQVFRMGVALIVTVAMARYLGPEDFGKLNFVMAITLLLVSVAELGLRNLLRKDFVDQPTEPYRLLGTSMFLVFLAGAGLYLTTLGIFWNLGLPVAYLQLFAWIGAILVTTPFNLLEVWFQSKVRSDVAVKCTVFAMGTGGVLKLFLVMEGYHLIWFAVVIMVEYAMVALLRLGYFLVEEGKIPALRLDRQMAAQLLKRSWPLILSGLAISIYTRTDQVMLGLVSGQSSVGTYAAASSISMAFFYLPQLLAVSLFPALVRAKSESVSKYEYRLQQYFDLNAAIGWGLALTLAFSAFWLIPFLFGQEYRAGSLVLFIHGFTLLFVFLWVARGQFLIAEGYLKFAFLSNAAGALVNILLNLALIPLWDVNGAAVATLISFAVAGWLCCFLRGSVRVCGVMQTKAILLPLRWKEFSQIFANAK